MLSMKKISVKTVKKESLSFAQIKQAVTFLQNNKDD